MLTFTYKTWFIHDNFTSGETTVQDLDNNIYKVESVFAAKLLITKKLKETTK